MKDGGESTQFRPGGFRLRLLVAMMLVATAMTAVVLYLAERNLARGAEQDMQRQFRAELATLRNAQTLRQAALLERCRSLVRKSRLHAALEDDALDLLYPSAKDELRDIMVLDAGDSPGPRPYALHAEFYRFLDRNGKLIPTDQPKDAGPLRPEEESQLVLSRLPGQPEVGYLAWRGAQGEEKISEVITMPIVSSETGEGIAAIVLGFKPVALGPAAESGIKHGLWLGGRLILPGLDPSDQAALGRSLAAATADEHRAEGSFASTLGGGPYQLFFMRLNPGSLYPPASEVTLYPLAGLMAQQRSLRWQIIGAGGLLLLAGFGASSFLAGRLTVPVTKLAEESVADRVQRERAEAALETTGEELQRAARFSADASHQLKTPLAVLRAGLEELQARTEFSPEVSQELSALMHQTYRLSSVIDDLLLLSRMDAGQLKLNFGAVDLCHLIEASLDDLEAQPDAAEITVEKSYPAGLSILGDKHYAGLILQNLLENARKYNCPGGRIRLTARQEDDQVFLAVGNTGHGIPESAQTHIFERFHRGAMGENVPGYGLGLNLARELARIHGGDLRLVRSSDGWTEFEVRFCAVHPVAAAAGGKA